MAEETSGPDRDWESELGGEVDRDEDECKDGERGREPGMVTGAEPASDLGPVSPRSCSSKSLSKDAMFMSLRRRSKAEPMTASTVLPAGSSGRARAGRLGSVVGEELPEPVLDARLDATLELMLGASG